MPPILFQFRSKIPNDYDDSPPWAMTLAATSALPTTTACLKCGARRMASRGEGRAAKITGGFWGDIVGAGSSGPGFMFSGRIVRQLCDAGATGFVPHPVRVSEIISKALRTIPRPDYFFLEITGTIQIDWEASGLDRPCSICGAQLRPPIPPPRQLFPFNNSWDGGDFCYGLPYGGRFCSRRVLELARKHAWTNFRFYAIDEIHDATVNTDGIDYLGKQWPPAWYADSPSFGKSADEWLEEYFSITFDGQDDYLRFQIAARALDDLGEQVLPELTIRFGKGSQRAAHAILSMSQRGTIVPQDLLDAAQQAYWSEQAKVNPHLFIRDPSGLWHPK